MIKPTPHDPETAKAVRGPLIVIIGLSTFPLGVFGGVWVSRGSHPLTDPHEDPGRPSFTEGATPPRS